MAHQKVKRVGQSYPLHPLNIQHTKKYRYKDQIGSPMTGVQFPTIITRCPFFHDKNCFETLSPSPNCRLNG